MKYDKPEVFVSGSALATIQGSLNKSATIAPDAQHPTQLVATSNAYEADE